MAEPNHDIVEQAQDDGIVTGDAEGNFLRAIESGQFNTDTPEEDHTQDQEPEQETAQEDELEPETDEDESETAEEEDEEENEEEGPKYSIRKDGKKVDVLEVLNETNHTVKINGEEEEVDYPELINGYQRGKDYANKTTELAKEREEMRPFTQMVTYAKEDPQFVEYVQSYFKNGPFPEAANNPLLKVSDEQLSAYLDENSDGYDPHKAADVIKSRNEWQKTAAERHQVTQRVNQQMQTQYNEWAQGEIEKAKTIIEQLGGEEAYTKDANDVRKSLSETGFSEQEIGQLVDARMAVVAWKAAQYDKMKNGAETLKVSIGKKRKKLTPPKAVSAGQGKSKPSSKKRQRDTLRRAVQSQSNDDWITAIEHRLKL